MRFPAIIEKDSFGRAQAHLKARAPTVTDLQNLLTESPLAETKPFIRSFIKEIKVTGDQVVLTYTIPIAAKGLTEEKLPVLSIVHDGGR